MPDLSSSPTFRECADSYIAIHKHGWRSAKTAREWPRFFELYVYPVIGHMAVNDVDLSHVLSILEPVWIEKTETADRLRSRVEPVLDWARVRGYREKDNPARWRGHLDLVLPNPSKVHTVRNHPALPYDEVSEFMARLDQQTGVDARVLEFTILTSVRTNETTKSCWEEIDMNNKLWLIDARRTKIGKTDCVPLSDDAIRVLNRVSLITACPKIQNGVGWVFSSIKRENAISNMSMLMLLRRLGRSDIRCMVLEAFSVTGLQKKPPFRARL